MPERTVDRALTDRGQSVNSAETLFSRAVRGVYDAATMQITGLSSIAFITAMAAVCAPLGAQAVDAPGVIGITLTATRAVGAEAVRITGTASAARPLEAALYVTYSKDLPTVLLSRRSISTDATGRYDATLSTAPAYFRNAILTVVVRAVPAGAEARVTLGVSAPNAPAPPDDTPASVR
jgi:hypothetical protein